jgi:mono/diheme cytochrome c family protein
MAAGGGLLIVGVAAVPAFAADDTARMAQGRQLFTETATPPCALCHTLADAGSQGEIGPVLDELKPDAKRVASALRTGLGVMPSYSEALTEEQIENLAYYVSLASGGAN